MHVESYATPVSPIALAWGGRRLWVGEPGGRVAVVLPAGAILERRLSTGTEIADLAWLDGRLWILGADGAGRVVDPSTGATLDRPALGSATGLATDGRGLWALDAAGTSLSRVGATEPPGIHLTERSHRVRWSDEGALWALPGPLPPARAPFRWRGLAPGADPFPPGTAAPALVRLDPETGFVEERIPLAQQAVAFAPDAGGLWVGIRAADGLERVVV